VHRNRIALAIAVFLMLSMVVTLVALPTAYAHTPPWNIPTYAYITVSPDPVGVGQQAFVIMWLDKLFSPETAIGNLYRFHNYQLSITDPNGAVQTVKFDIVADSTSAQPYAFTPDKVGTYTLKFTFPGQEFNAYDHPAADSLVNDTYLGSSAQTTLTVQQDPIPAAISGYPLPTSYWTRPIYGENVNWYKLGSNWLGAGVPGYSGWGGTTKQQSFPGDAVGSLTSHIMWTKQIQSGGVVGGNTVAIPGNTYFEGSAYSQRYINPIILDGMLFYNPPLGWDGVSGSFNTEPYGPTTCVDLQTGEVIWINPDIPAPSFGYIYDAEDPNQHGVWPPVLVSSTGGGFFSFGPAMWQGFDAFTGKWLFNITNVPSGTTLLGPSGEMLILSFVNYGPTGPFGVPTGPTQWYLQEWNSSRLWDDLYSGPSTVPTLTPPITDGSDPSLLDFNMSMPTLTTTPTIENAFYNDVMICSNGTFPGVPSFGGAPDTGYPEAPYNYFAINMKAGTIGTINWWNTVNAPAGNITVAPGGADPTADGGKGVFVEGYKETMQWVGYSMATGQKLWGPTESMAALDYFGNPAIPIIGGVLAYGKLYATGYAGILYAWDLKTGNLLWTYGNGGEGNSTNAGFNTPFGYYPMQINAVGNGVVYMVTTEHTIETPLFRGSVATAVNATDGSEIWTLGSYTGEFFGISYAMADGYNTWFNGYDNSIYVVGRGPSATTVSAPNVGISFGTPVVIRGTVTDVSAGTKQKQQAADFPNGVPVASDASMKDWMGYVYQQKPLPTDFTGVEVTVSVFDSNNNYRTIGTPTTDATGMYSLTWTPDIPGDFKVIVSFDGTNGYWPSYAQSTFTVMEAPAATVPPTPAPASIADQYFLPVSVGLFAAIAIVGVVLALLLRRR
jgi:PQQ-like domain